LQQAVQASGVKKWEVLSIHAYIPVPKSKSNGRSISFFPVYENALLAAQISWNDNGAN
jgi:hypothetical protein